MKIYPQLKLQIQVVVVLEAIIGRTLEQSLVEVLQEEVNMLNREAMNMMATVFIGTACVIAMRNTSWMTTASCEARTTLAAK